MGVRNPVPPIALPFDERRRRPTASRLFPLLVIGCVLAACGGTTKQTRSSTPTPGPSYTSAPTVAPTPTSVPTPTSAHATTPPTSRPTATPRSGATPPPSRPHVLVIMLENRGYAATLGNCSADPYLCSLASQFVSATSWYGLGHPSLPNYLAISSGSTPGCTSDGCATGITAPDLGGQWSAAGIPWRAYMESMPSPC